MVRLAFALALLLTLRAVAAPPDPATARARELFQHAEALYALTRYDEALAEYERAFEAKPLPGFLFNIGQCHRQLHHFAKASHFFHEYLDRAPTASNRAMVQSLIEEVDAAEAAKPPEPVAVERKDPPDAGAPHAMVPTVEPERGHASTENHTRWWLWALGGGAAVAVAVTVLGLVLGLSSSGPPSGSLGTIDAR